LQSVAAGAYLTIQPPTNEEWVIHNIYHEGSIQVELYDGTNSLVFIEESGRGVLAYFDFHVTNGIYLRVKNTESSAKLVGYDGVVTKSA